MRRIHIKYMKITASRKRRKNGEISSLSIIFLYIKKNKFNKMLVISNYGLRVQR